MSSRCVFQMQQETPAAGVLVLHACQIWEPWLAGLWALCEENPKNTYLFAVYVKCIYFCLSIFPM